MRFCSKYLALTLLSAVCVHALPAVAQMAEPNQASTEFPSIAESSQDVTALAKQETFKAGASEIAPFVFL